MILYLILYNSNVIIGGGVGNLGSVGGDYKADEEKPNLYILEGIFYYYTTRYIFAYYLTGLHVNDVHHDVDRYTI